MYVISTYRIPYWNGFFATLASSLAGAEKKKQRELVKEKRRAMRERGKKRATERRAQNRQNSRSWLPKLETEKAQRDAMASTETW